MRTGWFWHRRKSRLPGVVDAPTPLVLWETRKLGVGDVKATARKEGLETVRLEAALLRLGKPLPVGSRQE